MKIKKALQVKNLQGFMCPGLDLNQHAVSSTAPSRQRVYQFHHQGIKYNSVKNFAAVSGLALNSRML